MAESTTRLKLKLTLKQQDIDYVESLTRKQSNCLILHHVRCGRITALKVYDVLHIVCRYR